MYTPPEFLLDRELAALPPGEIERRQEFVIATYNRFGLKPDTATVIGGGAFALACLDARIEYGNETHGFDLDVLVIKDELMRLYETSGRTLARGYAYTTYFNSLSEPHLDAFSELKQRNELLGFEDVLEQSVVVEGCRTVLPILAADLRLGLRVHRGKAMQGVMKAHASAYRQELELANDPEWQRLVATACRLAPNRPPGERTEWLDELVKSPSGVASHPAFGFLSEIE